VSQRSRLHTLIDALRGQRVVLYGDLVLDRFIIGSPKRISREAPVIILRFEEQRDVPGGGANALANIASLGGTVLPVAAVGDDECGAAMLTILAGLGVDTGAIAVVPGFRTVTKVRILAGGPASQRHQVARYDIEDSLDPGGAWHSDLLAAIDRLAPTAAAAAISDYGYGVVSAAGVARLRAALPGGAPAIADSRFALTRLGTVDGATPNLEELAAAAGAMPRGDEAVAAAAEALRDRLGARFVVATRGSSGLTLAQGGSRAAHIPVYGTDQVADVTGAGDTVIAALTLAVAAGATPLDAALLANLAGGIVVMKLGTATVSQEELHRAVDLAPFLDD
jgi:D-glycero-beta-D-manno-heptose-7-phosphate kinase